MSYTAEELAQKRARGETRTDRARIEARTEEVIRRARLADPDADLPSDMQDNDWSSVHVGVPPPKRDIHIRIDADVLDGFKAQGKGYQTRINAVLRAYHESRRAAD